MDRRPNLAPLVLATMTSQALFVVLAPTMAAIADDLEVSVAAVGQARGGGRVAARRCGCRIRSNVTEGTAVVLGGALGRR